MDVAWPAGYFGICCFCVDISCVATKRSNGLYDAGTVVALLTYSIFKKLNMLNIYKSKRYLYTWSLPCVSWKLKCYCTCTLETIGVLQHRGHAWSSNTETTGGAVCKDHGGGSSDAETMGGALTWWSWGELYAETAGEAPCWDHMVSGSLKKCLRRCRFP